MAGPCCRSFTHGEEAAILTDAESRALHGRALAGNPAVSAHLWQQMHDPLLRRFGSRFRTLDPAEISDAVDDAIFAYVERPTRYDPDKRSLDGYLAMAVHGDLLNLLAKKKHQPTLIPLDPVAHDRPARNSEYEEGAVVDTEVRTALLKRVCTVIPEAAYRAVLELMADGERDSRRFAVLLGCADLDIAEQRRRVKQAKDLIRVRLKRNGIRFDG